MSNVSSRNIELDIKDFSFSFGCQCKMNVWFIKSINPFMRFCASGLFCSWREKPRFN